MLFLHPLKWSRGCSSFLLLMQWSLILLIGFKESTPGFVDFLYCFCILRFICLCAKLFCLLLLALGLVCFYSSISFKCKVRLLIRNLFFSLFFFFFGNKSICSSTFLPVLLWLYCVSFCLWDFNFHYSREIFIFPLWFILWPTSRLKACCLIFIYLRNFQFSTPFDF